MWITFQRFSVYAGITVINKGNVNAVSALSHYKKILPAKYLRPVEAPSRFLKQTLLLSVKYSNLRKTATIVVVIVIEAEAPSLCFSFGGKGSECKR
jgi:hypothetical protein